MNSFGVLFYLHPKVMAIYGLHLQGSANLRTGDPINRLMEEIFTSRSLAASSESDECFELANYWVQTCIKAHSP